MGSLSLTVNMFTSLLVSGLGLVSTVSAQAGCPEPYGLQVYPHEQYCDKFYKCANGTLTEEVCENGLVFDGYADVHNHCNYNWAVDCGKRVYDDTPISSPGCLYQYGIYPVGEGCQTTFFKCARGVAYETPCQGPGLRPRSPRVRLHRPGALLREEGRGRGRLQVPRQPRAAAQCRGQEVPALPSLP